LVKTLPGKIPSFPLLHVAFFKIDQPQWPEGV